MATLIDEIDDIRTYDLAAISAGLEANTNHDDDDDEDDEDSFLFDQDDLDDFSTQPPVPRIIQDVNEITTCLLRISMSLRNPARNDQIRYAETVNTKHFEPHDIDHVRMKFREAPNALTTRLGKAVSRHRQYFKYREEHHLKLAEGIDGDDDHFTINARPSTKATSLYIPPQPSEPKMVIPDSDTESVGTATSYAPTVSGDSALKPPPRPETVEEGEPFECPLCYYIITAPDERSWRQHVYEDLPPYVCTDQNCNAVTRQFSRRKEWRRHMKEHETKWLCPYECNGHFDTSQLFEQHLKGVHPESTSETKLATLLQTCTKSGEEAKSLQCPLCLVDKPNLNTWYKHVGHHLEQLALFAIPRKLLGEDSEAGSDESADEQGLADSSEDEELVEDSATATGRDGNKDVDAELGLLGADISNMRFKIHDLWHPNVSEEARETHRKDLHEELIAIFGELGGLNPGDNVVANVLKDKLTLDASKLWGLLENEASNAEALEDEDLDNLSGDDDADSWVPPPIINQEDPVLTAKLNSLDAVLKDAEDGYKTWRGMDPSDAKQAARERVSQKLINIIDQITGDGIDAASIKSVKILNRAKRLEAELLDTGLLNATAAAETTGSGISEMKTKLDLLEARLDQLEYRSRSSNEVSSKHLPALYNDISRRAGEILDEMPGIDEGDDAQTRFRIQWLHGRMQGLLDSLNPRQSTSNAENEPGAATKGDMFENDTGAENSRSLTYDERSTAELTENEPNPEATAESAGLESIGMQSTLDLVEAKLEKLSDEWDFGSPASVQASSETWFTRQRDVARRLDEIRHEIPVEVASHGALTRQRIQWLLARVNKISVSLLRHGPGDKAGAELEADAVGEKLENAGSDEKREASTLDSELITLKGRLQQVSHTVFKNQPFPDNKTGQMVLKQAIADVRSIRVELGQLELARDDPVMELESREIWRDAELLMDTVQRLAREVEHEAKEHETKEELRHLEDVFALSARQTDLFRLGQIFSRIPRSATSQQKQVALEGVAREADHIVRRLAPLLLSTDVRIKPQRDEISKNAAMLKATVSDLTHGGYDAGKSDAKLALHQVNMVGYLNGERLVTWDGTSPWDARDVNHPMSSQLSDPESTERGLHDQLHDAVLEEHASLVEQLMKTEAGKSELQHAINENNEIGLSERLKEISARMKRDPKDPTIGTELRQAMNDFNDEKNAEIKRIAESVRKASEREKDEDTFPDTAGATPNIPEYRAGYRCDFGCEDVTFQTAAELGQHRRWVHLSKTDYPHECSRCGLEFDTPKDLWWHLASTHKLSVPEPSLRNSLGCPCCSKDAADWMQDNNPQIHTDAIDPWNISLDSKDTADASDRAGELHTPTLNPHKLTSDETVALPESAILQNTTSATTCTNCFTQLTPLWRRYLQDQTLCNACSRYLKLHGVARPIDFKTDVIKKRNRGRGDQMPVESSGSEKKAVDDETSSLGSGIGSPTIEQSDDENQAQTSTDETPRELRYVCEADGCEETFSEEGDCQAHIWKHLKTPPGSSAWFRCKNRDASVHLTNPTRMKRTLRCIWCCGMSGTTRMTSKPQQTETNLRTSMRRLSVQSGSAHKSQSLKRKARHPSPIQSNFRTTVIIQAAHSEAELTST